MRHGMQIFFLSGLIAVAAAAGASADGPATAPGDGQTRMVTVPERTIPQPHPRGEPYPVPATNWERRPVLWGWTCERPDGSGLAFGGVDQTADDGRPHTRIMQAGQWKPIADQLRKANPLQARCEQVRLLREACKDALARARNLYFEGLTADEEARRIKGEVDPAAAKLSADLATLLGELKGPAELDDYHGGQVKFAAGHLGAAAGHIRPFGPRVTPAQMAAMRRAQIELEIAAEALDAEPPPRALSMIAWDPTHRLYVIFGGEHMDYATNDLWVFDPSKPRWSQRHPTSAPEPRADAQLTPLGDGRIAMVGGCIYEPGKGYVHVGPARWIYDLTRDAWTADGHEAKPVPSDSRSARYWPPAGPENYMAGERPDAAAHQALLNAIPANTWTPLKIPVALGSRDWATWAYDPDRDMLYVWAGGHASYPGNDVARFHLATGRWEITDPIEMPLGCCGTNEQYPSGVNFNRRPWVKKHVWNGQTYDLGLRQLVLTSVNDAKLDPYCYFYDPDKSDWAGRSRLPDGMGNDAYGAQLRWTRHGLLHWYGDQAWLLDPKTRRWSKLAVKGALPGTAVDSCGMVYDSKRDRMLFATLGGYAKPFNGQLYSLDMSSLKVELLNPEGTGAVKDWRIFLREPAYHPGGDLVLWPQLVNSGGKAATDRFVAYDADKNRWVTVRLNCPVDRRPFTNAAVCTGLSFDRKRGLFWLGDSGYGGGVWALKFDPGTAEIAPLEGQAGK